MILVADSGSTKAEWVAAGNETADGSLFTSGISPIYLGEDEIVKLLEKELGSLAGKNFERVYFYGTGCNSTVNEDIVKRALHRFLNSEKIFVGSDVLAAAHSLCGDKPGIACILGTGSNSCYYDGKRIVSNVSPLGYILGDEGSAAVIGKRLVSDILKRQLPAQVIDRFFETYKTSTAEIIENVYKKPFPSRYLGQFTRFISANIELPALQELINSSFDDFIKRNVLLYPEAQNVPIHFTGGIAFHFSEFLIKRVKKAGLTPGVISLSPMANLIKYHTNNQH